MGNGRCPCYYANKKICRQCPIKHCGKCLSEKGSSIKHEHKCHNCNQCISLDNKKHNCICRNCNTSYIEINTSKKSLVCDQCKQSHEVHLRMCAYCEET